MKSYQRRAVKSSFQKINTTIVVESYHISIVGQYGKQLSLNFFATSIKMSCFTPHIFPFRKFFQMLANPV
ncbi:hypothetical protein DPE81_12310 [Salmonella enterica subsp. enterica]|nr:hypothetical protein [Salmonella enterica]EBG5098397.1 hypothetical protein [Salmonella enterica subsp. enterica serovar India]EBG5207194.1 hypothetical protein [Salmonella enterica subsp. enterica serovar Geraldton]ECI4109760.1 hypothetical protein [Salmonella enterica subsp. enterica]EGZ4332923.1 hypothetical protein [Salmonella enterica subsp. enterica serovar Texas]